MDFWSFSIRFKRTSVTNRNLGKTFNSSSELPIIFDRVDFCPDFCANFQFRTEKFRMALIAGGLPDLSLLDPEAAEDEPTAYEGCMRDLIVNGKHYHLNEIGNVVVTSRLGTVHTEQTRKCDFFIYAAVPLFNVNNMLNFPRAHLATTSLSRSLSLNMNGS